MVIDTGQERLQLSVHRAEVSESDIIAPADLQLSIDGYIKVFQFFLPSSQSREDAFTKVERYCEMKGYRPRYSDFKSFEQVYYRFIKKQLSTNDKLK